MDPPEEALGGWAPRNDWTPESGRSLPYLAGHYSERTLRDPGRRRTRANTVSKLEAALCDHYNARYKHLLRVLDRYNKTRLDPGAVLHRGLDDIYVRQSALHAPAPAVADDDDDDEAVQFMGAESACKLEDGGFVSSGDEEEAEEAPLARFVPRPVKVKDEPGLGQVSLMSAAYPSSYSTLPRP